MKKALKWFGIVLGSLIGLILLLLVGLYTKARLEFTTKYDVQVETISAPSDTAALKRGEHLAMILCTECHGEDLGGNPDFFAGSPLGSIATPNLTAGAGGLGQQLQDEDFIRVLRHGVKPNGESVFLMPAQDFRHLTDADLAAIIAYLRTLPAVDRQTPEPHVQLSLLGNVLYGAGKLGRLLRADLVRQAGPVAVPPTPEVSADYGEYLVNINGCRDCHGQQLAGAKPADPDSMYAPNLTPEGVLALFSEADFIKVIRTGVTPWGGQISDRFMPWRFKGKMTDEELQAIWLYLQSLPALPTAYEPAE